MVTDEAYLEVWQLASEATSEAESLSKRANLEVDKLDKVSHLLVDCGMIQSSQRDKFIKLANENHSSLLTCIEWMAKEASKKTTGQPTGVGTVVKANTMASDVPECDRSFVALVRGR